MNNGQPEIVVIGLCTCKRPQMLRNCIASLVVQSVPEGCAVQVVVVDNDEQGGARSVVESFVDVSPYPVHYVHEPVRGIARARNAILNKAEALGANWIAMLDDDEVAAPNWLQQLMVAEYRSAPILIGRVTMVYPEERPFWAPEERSRPLDEGAPAKYLRTGNVRFRADIARSGLRFDERLDLAGGEDQRFFATAKLMGYEARQTDRAVTYETAHVSRLTYGYQVGRNYAHQASLAFRRRQDDGIKPLLASVPMLLLSTPLGVLELALSPVAFIFSRRRFKQFALRGGKRLARVAGIAAALVGHLPQPYRQVMGH